MSKIRFLVCGDVKAPQRKHGDAGFDLFVPNYSDEFRLRLIQENNVWDVFDNELGERNDLTISKTQIILDPGADIKIPSFIRSLISDDECLRMSNKSGVALKQKLLVGAEIIDSSYEGIINIHVFNVSNHKVSIEFGQKIVQLVPFKINNEDHEIEFEKDLSVEDFYKDHDHSRGSGGFGSTGLK